MHNETLSEADILSAVVAPDEGGLPHDLARSILSLRFGVEAQRKMDELAEKNRQGTISPDERTAMEKYIRVGNFLNLMQARARRSLEIRKELIAGGFFPPKM